MHVPAEAAPPLAVRELSDHVRAIDIEGDITSTSEARVLEAFRQASAQGVRTIVLDFAKLEYLNSGGIGVLVKLLGAAQHLGQHVLACGASDVYRDVFRLTRLDQSMSIRDAALGDAPEFHHVGLFA